MRPPLSSGGRSATPPAPSAAPAAARSARLRLALLALLVFGLTFALRAVHLNRAWDIHVDELTYLNLSQNVAGRWQVRLYGESFYLHPPLYFFLEGHFLRLLGSAGDVVRQIYTARYLNVMLAGLSAALLLLLGRRLVGGRAGAWAGGLAAGLFALDPFVTRVNSQTLLETSALFWVLLGWTLVGWALGGAGPTPAPARWRPWRLGAAGLAFGLALLTKEMTVFLTVLPLAVCALTRWALPRRAATGLAAAALGLYALYPLTAVLAGHGRLYAEEKFSGLARFVGAVKPTGFRRGGGPSLGEALLANLQTYAPTYALTLTGLVAIAGLWRLARRPGRARLLLLALITACAYLQLAFSVLIGTLEEQFFYYLTVPSMLASSVALLWWCREARARGRLRAPTLALLGGAGLAFAGWSLVAWAAVHLTPGNGYEQLRAYLRRHVAPGSRISTTTQESQFLTQGYTTGVWASPEQLRRSRAQYVILSTQQVERGYGYASPQLRTWLDRHATLVLAAPSRSYGTLNLYRLPASIAGGPLNDNVTVGRGGWLFLPTEYRSDAAPEADPSAYVVNTVGRIGQLLRARGSRLEVLLVPTKTRVYARQLPGDLTVPEGVQTRYGRTLTGLRAAGVLAPDLAAAFAGAARAGAAPLFLRQDHHWTPQGAQLAARAAAGALRGQVDLSGLPPLRASVRPLPPRPSELRSLVNLLPPAQRAGLAPERYQPIQVDVTQAGGAGNLLGSDAVGVALTGSSFSTIPSLGFGPLLESALGTEVLNAAEPSIGPWRPLLNYVQNDAYRQAPPKLVVWEFWENFLNNQGVGTVPLGYLLDAAAAILNDCPGAGEDRPVPTRSGPATAPYFDVPVAGAAQPLGDYLHLRLRAPGASALRVEFISRSNLRRASVPFPSDGAAHDLNLPIYPSAGAAVERVRVYPGAVSAGAGDGAVMDKARLCHMPGYVIAPSYLNIRRLDLLSTTSPPNVGLGGLSEIESTGHRWGLGRATSLEFFSAQDRALTLHLKFRVPVAGQQVRISANGAVLAEVAGLAAGDVADLRLRVPVRTGLNAIRIEPSEQNHVTTTFAPGDPRPTSVEFTRLLLSED